jgi:hypothetical protein
MRNRDVEIRLAVKAAVKQARKTLWDSIPPGMDFDQAREREHGSLFELEARARAAARKTLRERWAKEDGEWATQLAPNLTRIAPGGVRKTDGDSLAVIPALKDRGNR